MSPMGGPSASASLTLPAGSVGVGLRSAHFEAFFDTRAQRPDAVDFVEVHAENFMATGGLHRAVLKVVRQSTPVSLHAVGLGLGSAVGIDTEHLARLADLVRVFEPSLVSDHACFCRAPLTGQRLPVHGADLLPLAFNEASLHLLTRHVDQVQEALSRPILVENLSAYLRFDDSTLSETDFLAELCQRTGCGLLLDVNNLVVNALNDGADAYPEAVHAACQWLDALASHPQVRVGEMHLAGHRSPDTPETLVVDDHSQPVNDAVWQVHDHALRHWPGVPRLIEWDVDIPPFDTLLAQADQARRRSAANGQARRDPQ
jgi:uncharacterized protein